MISVSFKKDYGTKRGEHMTIAENFAFKSLIGFVDDAKASGIKAGSRVLTASEVELVCNVIMAYIEGDNDKKGDFDYGE